uniref:ASD2 domain-containing protein n=1 Tax=Branchiostoma floridae TaxID=7739 RepID=C3YZ92_BRAFL|eukprot:XP_002598151.1 hypothetical protein BRAFLDRAFT_123295 [Branchiostoma floridae]
MASPSVGLHVYLPTTEDVNDPVMSERTQKAQRTIVWGLWTQCGVVRRESQADIVPPPPTEEPKTVPAQEKGSMHTESVTKVVQPSGFGGVKHRVKKRHDPPERPRSWHSTHEAINSHPDVVPDFEPMPVSSNQARYSQQRRDRAASSFDSTGRDNSMFHGSSMENMSKSSFVCAQYQPPASAGFPKKSGSVYDQLSSTAGINYKDSLSTKKPEEEEHSYPRSQSLTNMKAKELQHADMRYVKTMYVPGTRPKEEDAVFWPTSTSPSERKRNRSSGSSSDFQGGSNRNSLGVDIPAPPWRRSSTSPSSSSSSTTSPQLGPQSARSPPPPPVRDQSSHKAVSNMVHHSKYPSWPGPSSMLAPEPHAMSKSHDNPLRMLNNPPTGHQRSPDYVNQEVFSHYSDQRGNHAGNGKRGSHGDQWGSFSQPSDHQRPYPQLTAVVHPVQPVQPSFADTVEIGQNGTYKVQKEGGKEMEKVEFRVQINMDGTPRYPSDRRVPSPPERDLSPEKQVSPAAKQLSPTSSSRDQNLNYINNLQKKSPKYEDSGFYYEEKPTEGTVAAHNYRNERERQQGPNQWYNNKSNNHYSREFKHTEPPDHDKQKLTREVGKPDPRHSSLSGHHSSSTENVTREEGGQKTAVQLLRSQFEDPLKTRSILRTETVNFGQPGGLPGGVKKISRAQSERNLEPKWVRDMRKERSMRNVNGGINHQDTPLIFNLFKEGKKDQDAKLKERRASSEMLAMHAKKSTTLPDNLRYNPPTFDYWRQMEKEQTQQKSKKSDQGGRTDDQKVRMQDEDGYKNYLKEAQDKVLHRTSYTKTEFEHICYGWKAGFPQGCEINLDNQDENWQFDILLAKSAYVYIDKLKSMMAKRVPYGMSPVMKAQLTVFVDNMQRLILALSSDRKLSNGSSGSDVFIEDSTSLRHKEALVAAKSPTRSWEEKKSVNGVHEARVRKISPLKEEPLPPPPPSPPPAEPEPPTMEFLDFLPPPPPELLHDEEAGVDMESPPPPPPVEDSPRQDNHRHHSPATVSPEHISPNRPHAKAMPPRTVSPSEISSPTDSSGSKTPSPPSSEHSRSSSRSSSEKSGSSDSHTVPTRDSSPSIGSSVSSLKDESERTRQPSGEKRISISPIHIRQKTPEEIKTDELAKDIIDRCDDKNLKEILMEPNHKTADYMRECFPEAVQPLQPSERRRSSAASVRGKSRRGEDIPAFENKQLDIQGLNELDFLFFSKSKATYRSHPSHSRSLSETQLPPTSPYFTESSAKAKMMLEMRRQQEEEAEAVEEEEDQEVLDQKKVTEWAKEMTKSNEFDKYQRFVDELDKITNLLLSLSGRLARAQNALQNIEEGTDPAEKRELQDKRDRLSDQYDDAKKLKENIDNRKDAVSKILTEYFNEEQFADFEHFIKMKSQLIMESRELDDKIKLGEEQLRCLRENLSMDT